MTAPRPTAAGPGRRLPPRADALPRLLASPVRADLERHLARLGPLRTDEAHGVTELTGVLEDAGLTGRGGSGFPTAVKMAITATSARHARRRALVVVNAMEGEPASVKDRLLLQLAPHLVLDGALAAAEAVGADEIVVCVPRTPATVAWAGSPTPPAARLTDGVEPSAETAAWSIRSAAEERAHELRLGPVVTLARPPDRYLSGEGTALARWLEGGPARPAFSRLRLAQAGVEGRPTLLDNAETFAHIGLIARFGSAWFRGLGTCEHPGTALVTVSGAVGRVGVAEAPYGSTVAEVIGLAGGPSEPLQAVLLGGFGGTWVPLPRAGTLALHPPLLGPGIAVALPGAACGLAETARVVRYMAGESAGQCGPCAFGLPALASALEELASPTSAAGATRAHADLARWTGQIAGRGACGHPDGVVRLVRSALVTFGADVDLHKSGHACGHVARPRLLPVPAHPPRRRVGPGVESPGGGWT